MFKELAHIFSDDDNQRRSREVLNRVSSCVLCCQ